MVKSLRANILIGNNILASESFLLNVGLFYALVESCGVKITVRARQKGQFLKKKLVAEKNEVIPLCSETIIPLLPVPFLDNKDFLFHLTAELNLMLFVYIIHHDTKKVLVRNTSDRPLRTLRYQRLGHIVGICYNNCFLADAGSAFDTIAVSSWIMPFPPGLRRFFSTSLLAHQHPLIYL